MVGGLVQKQQVRLACQFAGDRQAPLPSARERIHLRRAVGESGPAQREVKTRGTLGVFEPIAGNGRADHLSHRAALGKLGVLRHVAHASIAAGGDLAGVGFQAPGEYPQQGRLAAAIGADQAQPLAFGNAERNPPEQLSRAEAFVQIGAAQQNGHG
jgi:hypothetical protein